MLYLGNGIYFDMETLVAFQLNGDNRRPTILFDGKTEPETVLNNVSIFVRNNNN
jgi:hypothetical protein